MPTRSNNRIADLVPAGSYDARSVGAGLGDAIYGHPGAVQMGAGAERKGSARLAALRSSLTVLALIALIAVFLAFRIPKTQAASKPDT